MFLVASRAGRGAARAARPSSTTPKLASPCGRRRRGDSTSGVRRFGRGGALSAVSSPPPVATSTRRSRSSSRRSRVSSGFGRGRALLALGVARPARAAASGRRARRSRRHAPRSRSSARPARRRGRGIELGRIGGPNPGGGPRRPPSGASPTWWPPAGRTPRVAASLFLAERTVASHLDPGLFPSWVCVHGPGSRARLR